MYDPIVFWRPKKNTGIFDALGIRQTFIDNGNTPCTILTYEDSNTLGAYQGGFYEHPWPDLLAERMGANGDSIHLLNMGVMGYSSYQGLQQFRQDIEIFHPSLVVVSFGWNDAAPTMGIPDSNFSPYLATFLSPLQASRLFQVIKYYSDKIWVDSVPYTSPEESRVSYEDYQNNLEQFISLAKSHGATVLLLTRPHADFSHMDPENWRTRVPKYNQIVRVVAQTYGVSYLDWEKIFSEEFPNELIDDCHFSEIGHELAGKSIYEFLQR